MDAASERPGTAAVRYQVRTLLALVWSISCLFASFRIGVPATIAFGIPLGILGYFSISGRKLFIPAVPLAACLSLAALTLPIAMPVDLNTALTLLGGAAWCVLLPTLLRKARRIAVTIPVLLQFFLLLFCWQPRAVAWYLPPKIWLCEDLVPTSIQDVRGGRTGISVLGLRFVTSTNNLELIEHYLGPVEAEWIDHCLLIPVRDGNERVASRSILRQEYLPDILNKLPNWSARRQVLLCSSDSKNKMRAHQELLLVALYLYDYPPGFDTESWWAKHSHLFRPEYDPNQAVMEVWRWREMICNELPPCCEEANPKTQASWIMYRHCRAAKYQEEGGWGGDQEFGELYRQRALYEWSKPQKDVPNNVAWWPCRR